MNCVIIQSPIVQLNTPYPSGAYLQSFFKMQKTLKFDSVKWMDFSNELFNAIFSKDGLKLIFDNSSEKALQMADSALRQGDENTCFNLRRYIMQKESWIKWIEPIKAILCEGKISGRELCHEFVFSPFAPKGARMDSYLAQKDEEGSEITVDDARFLACYALADLADYITAVYDQNFSLVRYAESLATSERDFAKFETTLDSSVMQDFLEPLTTKLLQDGAANGVKTLFCVSVPFAGCFASCLSICRKIRALYGDNAIICIGGGYINTELRNTKERALFKYVDFISYDRGYGSYIDLMQNDFSRDGRAYYKTAYIFKDVLVPPSNESLSFESTSDKSSSDANPSAVNSTLKTLQKLEDDFTRTVFPDYSNIDFTRYPRLADDKNPMHRIWSDGAWLKAYMAHGCYWHKCAFCDTTLDYVCAYKRIDCSKLYAHLKEQAEKTGIYGIHFVDEACPPRSLIEFGKENCLSSENSRRLNFWGNVRFEKSFNRDVTDFLAYSGLTGVSGGIEIATGSGLEKVNKGTDFESLISACCCFKEAGILVHAYMIYGFYSETDADTINSMEVLRQMFSLGLLDSSFWHKFVLTKHSTLYKEYLEGKHPALRPILEATQSSWFAENDIHFEGEEKSVKFDNGLNIALDCWMHGQNLNRNVQSYFDFPVPKPSIPKDYVEKAVEKYEENKLKRYDDYEIFAENIDDFYWLASSILTIECETNAKISWQYFGETFEANVQDKTTASEIALFLESLRPESRTRSTKCSLINRKLYKKLRGNGRIRS